jgi:16S rRNA (uracil1498-N3)-methyltransferase
MSDQKQRRLRRFFSSEPLAVEGQELRLPASEGHHLRDILRLQEGASCLVTDGRGQEAEAVIKKYFADGAALVTLSKLIPKTANHSLVLKLYVGIPQRGKMDDLVEKAQELQVQVLVPLNTERTIIKMAASAEAKVLHRWEKIAQEAAKQSGNTHLIQIQAPTAFKKALETIPESETMALFHPEGNALSFQNWIENMDAHSTLHLFIGPEGGFSDKEVQMVRDKKGQIVRLGTSILKVDTAFVGSIAALRFLFP